MKSLQADMLTDATLRLAEARTGDAAWEAILRMAADIGANAVNGVGFLSESKVPVWARSSMEPAWLQEYQGAALHEVDPLVIGVGTDTLPSLLKTGRLLPCQTPDPPRDGHLHEGLRRHRYGWFISNMLMDGGPVGRFLTMSFEGDPRHALGGGASVDGLAALTSLFTVHLTPSDSADFADVFGVRYGALSPREKDVLALLAHGLHNEAIADRLGVAEVTVRMHLRHARTRMGARSREQTLALALLRGQLSL